MSTVVIGSGVTGMSAALLLAGLGEEVTLVEAKDCLAPLLSGFSRNGLFFDTGFHCAGGLGRNGLLRRWLGALGLWRHIGEEELVPIGEEFRFPDGRSFVFPADRTKLASTLSTQFSPVAQEDFCQLADSFRQSLAFSPYTDPAVGGEPHLAWENGGSLSARLDQTNLPAELRAMISSMGLLFGVTAEYASLLDYSLVAGLYMDSSHALRGGGRSLAEAFDKALKRAGVAIRLGKKATCVRHVNRNVSAVELEGGETLACNACVFTGHPRSLRTLVGESPMRPVFFKHAESMEETTPALLLFGETASSYLANRAVYLLPPPSECMLQPMGAPYPTVYLIGGTGTERRHSFTAVAACRAPFEGNPWPRPAAYIEWKSQETERLRANIEARLPEIAPIVLHDSASELSMRRWIAGSTGSMYGIAHTVSTLPLLPVTKLGGFMLAGQSILLPGVLGGIISAALAVGFLKGHDAALRGFRTWQENG